MTRWPIRREPLYVMSKMIHVMKVPACTFLDTFGLTPIQTMHLLAFALALAQAGSSDITHSKILPNTTHIGNHNLTLLLIFQPGFDRLATLGCKFHVLVAKLVFWL